MSISWSSSEIPFAAALGCVAICFMAHLALTQNKEGGNIRDNIRKVLFMRYAGLIIFGVIPSIAMFVIARWKPIDFGITASITTEGWLWLAGLTPLFIGLSYINASRPDNLVLYPQVRNPHWTRATFFHEYSSWVVYLVGYETLFRGILLFGALSVMSAWSAIALMAVINGLSHLPKGLKETAVSLPGSILFGYITIVTGSIWVSVAVHSVMALSTSWFSFRAHAEMSAGR